jgi:hypothetical protein
MVNCFIEIRKAVLKRRLKELHVRNKYHDKICDDVKKSIETSLETFIQGAVKKNTGCHDVLEEKV